MNKHLKVSCNTFHFLFRIKTIQKIAINTTQKSRFVCNTQTHLFYSDYLLAEGSQRQTVNGSAFFSSSHHVVMSPFPWTNKKREIRTSKRKGRHHGWHTPWIHNEVFKVWQGAESSCWGHFLARLDLWDLKMNPSPHCHVGTTQKDLRFPQKDSMLEKK